MLARPRVPGPSIGLWTALLLSAIAAFLVLSALAADAYPGGTYCEPQAPSYRFWGNFLCDVTQPRSLRGQDNARAASLARAAFAALAAAFVPFWWLLGGLAGGRTGRAVRLLGLISALATTMVAWVPSARSPALHAASVFGCAVPGLAAAGTATLVLLRGRGRPRAERSVGALGALTIVCGTLNAAGYAHAVAVRAACVPWLPVVQKITAVLALAWMISVICAAARRHAADDLP